MLLRPPKESDQVNTAGNGSGAGMGIFSTIQKQLIVLLTDSTTQLTLFSNAGIIRTQQQNLFYNLTFVKNIGNAVFQAMIF